MQPFVRGAGRSMIVFIFGLTILAGCRSANRADEGQGSAIPGDAATYQLKGIVVSSDAAKGIVTIDTEAIPGLMGAMTMPYKLAQPGVATELHPGDHVMARLRVSTTASVLDQIDVTAQAKPDYKPEKFYNVPAPGQAVPNFKFLNQSGNTISIEQFRGKVLLVTFIYTRCPLPDYCIRMSRNFATIQKQLAADPALYDKTHLLSVSFDPGARHAKSAPQLRHSPTLANMALRLFHTGISLRLPHPTWTRWTSFSTWA